MNITCIDSLLPGKNTPIGVAVSMGIDSVAALLYLRARGYNVVPIHYNHNLRFQNDVMQLQFCKLITENNFIGKTNITSHPKTDKTESQCRNNRIDYFRQICNENNIKYVVTAHHLDDCVESYLLNCFRGHPDYQPIKLVSDFVSFKIVHPFLLTEKCDFESYVNSYDNGKYKKYVVVDETNDVVKGSRRNWIRNVIVPELASQKISLKKFCREQIRKQVEKMFDGTV